MIPKLLSSIIKLIFAIINAIIPRLPEILLILVSAITSVLFSDTGGISNVLSIGITKLLKTVMDYKFWINVLQSLAGALGEIIKGAFSGIGNIFSGGSSGGGESTEERVAKALLTGGLSEIFRHANGTNNASRGLAIVGEAGPELVKFRGGEQVLNNRNTNKALAEMGGKTINQNITFNNLQDTTAYAMMNQLKQYNRQMAINGVI